MKAIVLKSFGDTSCLKLKDVKTPEPRPGEVRIKIKASGFNPIDFKIRKGIYGGPIPRVLGAECSGVVDGVGSNVQDLSLGDEVFAMTYGACSNGSYAEFVCLPSQLVVKKPQKLTFEQAAAIPLVSMTAYRTMISPGAIKEGDVIFIAGIGGGVGYLAVQLAKTAKVSKIYTVAGSQESATFIEEKLGINKDQILIYEGSSIEELQKKFIEKNCGYLFDATFDFVGGDMKSLCLQLTNYSGHFSTILPEKDEFPRVWKTGDSVAFSRSLSLHTVNVAAESHSGKPELLNIYTHHLSHIANLFERGELQSPAIETIGHLSEQTVSQAHKLLETGRVKGKLVMQVI